MVLVKGVVDFGDDGQQIVVLQYQLEVDWVELEVQILWLCYQCQCYLCVVGKFCLVQYLLCLCCVFVCIVYVVMIGGVKVEKFVFVQLEQIVWLYCFGGQQQVIDVVMKGVVYIVVLGMCYV